MKYLVVGRSGCGKDTAAKCLEEEFGWKFVKSYSTRKPRFSGEDTHIFISKEEAAKVPSSEKAAVTFIKNGKDCDEYFATVQQVKECDAYIVDPYGVYQLLDNMPDEKFTVICVYAPSAAKRFKALRKRGDSVLSCIARSASERKRFKEFEHILKTVVWDACVKGTEHDSMFYVMLLRNDYTDLFKESIKFRVGCLIRDVYPKAMSKIDADKLDKCRL